MVVAGNPPVTPPPEPLCPEPPALECPSAPDAIETGSTGVAAQDVLLVLVLLAILLAGTYLSVRSSLRGRTTVPPRAKIEILTERDPGIQHLYAPVSGAIGSDMRVRAVLDPGDQTLRAEGPIVIDEGREDG